VNEIDAYVEGVRKALAGLSAEVREELLEDLPEHLAEVRAEGSGTLVERLGTPEAYAAELRATAGLVGDFPEPPEPRFPELMEARDNILEILRNADVRVGPVIGYEKASDFLRLLRPAWWVARGYLAAMAIAFLIHSNQGNMGLLPRIGDNEFVALVLLAGCVTGSIVLARRSTDMARMPRYALRAGTAFLIIFALAGFQNADSYTRNRPYSDPNYVDYSGGNPYSNINDVFVYDGQGQLVNNARLFDQEGNPIKLGDNYCTDATSGESSRSVNLGYPYCPQNAPFTNTNRSASPSTSGSGSGSPSSSTSPSAAPGSSASPPAPPSSPAAPASTPVPPSPSR
jgi:HAAS domain-containing protein